MFSYSPKLRRVLCILYSRLDDTINMLLLSKPLCLRTTVLGSG